MRDELLGGFYTPAERAVCAELRALRGPWPAYVPRPTTAPDDDPCAAARALGAEGWTRAPWPASGWVRPGGTDVVDEATAWAEVGGG